MKPISLVGRHCYPFFRDHLHNPYPTSQEKEAIVAKANSSDVTLVSVSNWFANSRRRSGWIELCNEYYNGDTKLMVEICSHVLINGGESRSNDPPTLVDKVLKMERKVRSWHEGESEPSAWAIALCDLLVEFETRLQLEARSSVTDHPVVFTPPTSGDQNEDTQTLSVVGVKRNLEDYISESYASDFLPRSVSVSSISSISSQSSECYSSEEEERPVKRSRTHARSVGNESRSSPESPTVTQCNRSIRPSSLHLKRRFSAASFSENSENSERICKRIRLPSDIGSQGNSHEPILVQCEQSIIHSPVGASSQPTIRCTEFPDNDISLMPTVDLQPPDASWSLDINLYDWSSSPDILSMMDPNIQPQQSFPAFMTTVINEDERHDPEQWLQSFFMTNFSEIDVWLPEAGDNQESQAVPSITQTPNGLDQSSLVDGVKTTTQGLPDNLSTTQQTVGDRPEAADLEITTPEVDNVLWPLPSDPDSDPFPADFPETFLDSSCSSPFLGDGYFLNPLQRI